MPATIPDRRVLGTLALAVTNLTAACVLINPDGFGDLILHRYATGLFPPTVWGGLFAVSAVTLTVSIVVRRWDWFNVGAGVSMFVWTFLCVGASVASVRGGLYLSPVAYALFVWMVLGQAAMLFAPLLAGRPAERVEGDV